MKKVLLTAIAAIFTVLTPANVLAANVTVTTPAVQQEAKTAEKDPNTVKVKINGVEMTQTQARLVIINNIKNHRQMTPKEMVAYINSLEVKETTPEAAPINKRNTD